MAELSAIMARRTITATLTGLSENHNNGRTFHWYLDGNLVKTEQTKEHLTFQEYTYAAVPYRAEHTVTVQVKDYDNEEEFGSFSVMVADPLALWSWDGSNGTATAAQTQAAYVAATTQGQTADFSRHVWNDFVERLASAVQAWNGGYGSIDDTLMAAKYDALTADRFNAVVQNIGNPWMYWAYKNGRKGYLGRLAVKGYKQSGDAADIVYGDYLVELAYMLNVLIDAEGEFNAGYAARMGHIELSGLHTSESLPLRNPPSRHLNLYETLYPGRDSHSLNDPPSRHLEKTGSLWTVPDLTFRTDESKHLVIRDRLRIIRDLVLVASNEREMHIDRQTKTTTDILFAAAASRIMGISANPKTTPDMELGWGASLPLSAVIRFIANGDITLSANGVTELLADIAEISSILADLSPSASSSLDIMAEHTSASDLLLVPADTAQLLHEGAAALSDMLTMAAPTGSHMAHRSVIDFLLQMSHLSVSTGAKMGHRANVGVGVRMNALLITPTGATMAHEAARAISTDLIAMMGAPTSAHMAYRGGLALRALFFAAMNAPSSVNMAFTAKSRVAISGTQALSDPPSVWMAASASNRFRAVGEFDFSDVPSVHMDADIEETLQGAVDAELAAQPSTKLPCVTAESATGTDGTLTPLPFQQIAHDGSLGRSTANAELAARDSVPHTMDGVYVTVFAAALALEGAALPEWVTQEGTNLYIRGIWSSWADGDNLQIDTAEFYEPVRDGANLYIRSVNEVWTDGSSANIDTEFFLDPIQTGSNLHIRMDVLGG